MDTRTGANILAEPDARRYRIRWAIGAAVGDMCQRADRIAENESRSSRQLLPCRSHDANDETAVWPGTARCDRNSIRNWSARAMNGCTPGEYKSAKPLGRNPEYTSE